MDTQIFEFRDVTAGYVIQSFLLSCISEELNVNGDVKKAISKFYKEFENMGADKKIINNLIFNTTTMIWVLYFCVCLAKENNEILNYSLKNVTLGEIIEINGKYSDLKMDEFAKIMRNAIAHMDFKWYKDGSINVFNNERVEIARLEISLEQDMREVINFSSCSSKYVIVSKRENEKMYLLKKKYKKTFDQTFTFEQMKSIVNFYNMQYVFNVLGKNKNH